PWLQRLWATPRERKGSRIIGDIDVQPNGEQVITVPAGVKLSLTLHTIEIQWTHVTFQNIRLEQGQIYDLGSIELPETFKVNVKVVDSHERPVQGVRVRQVENNGNYYGQQLVTDENGYVSLQVVPYSSGKFAIVYLNRETRENLNESVNYQVSGPEDAGKEFLLQISDEMLYRILNQGE
ncbi:MAG: Ig-like domain-containing protein, partial [Sedimentisphaerales bacterium]